MILDKNGQKITIDGVALSIGMEVVGTDASEYSGLVGYITEIRTDKDMDTENKGPDIYCSFNPPDDPVAISETERLFSNLYGEPKRIDDIIFDCVIMAPDMITPVNCDERDKPDTGLAKAILKFTLGFAERNR